MEITHAPQDRLSPVWGSIGEEESRISGRCFQRCPAMSPKIGARVSRIVFPILVTPQLHCAASLCFRFSGYPWYKFKIQKWIASVACRNWPPVTSAALMGPKATSALLGLPANAAREGAPANVARAATVATAATAARRGTGGQGGGWSPRRAR